MLPDGPLGRAPRHVGGGLIARGYRVLLRGIDVFMLSDAVAAFRD